MTALPAGHPALRARLADALGSLLADVSHREIGRWTGRKGETITARGSDIDAWPFSELLILSQQNEEVREALVACVVGEEAKRIGPDVAAMASDLLQEITRRREVEEKRLIPALTACAREAS